MGGDCRGRYVWALERRRKQAVNVLRRLVSLLFSEKASPITSCRPSGFGVRMFLAVFFLPIYHSLAKCGSCLAGLSVRSIVVILVIREMLDQTGLELTYGLLSQQPKVQYVTLS